MSLLYCLDNRERELIERLPEAKVATLPVGDIWIGISGETILPGGIVLERKAISDMEASMIDGRYREQRTRLQAFAKDHGCQIGYIFEGSLDRSYRFSKSVLWKWLVRLPYVHKIPYFQTKDVNETAEFVKTFVEKWKEDEKDFREGKVTTYSSTIKNHTKGEQRDDPHNFAISVLSCCKGISPQIADAILKKLGNLNNVWKATEQEIAAIPISDKRKVGPANAKKLVSLLHGDTSN